MKKALFTSLAVSFLTHGLIAQNFEWVISNGGPFSDQAKAIALDASGNSYTTGYFNETVDFDPSAAELELTSTGGQDIYVQKLSATGALIWVKKMGGAADEQGFSIAVDGAGNVYTTGYFEGTVDFDPNAGTTNLTSMGDYDVYVQKLSPDGNLIWAKRMGGSSLDGGDGITVDGAGNVYTVGMFSGIVDFDPNAGIFDLGPTGLGDIFIQKLDTDGNFVWGKSMGGSSFDLGNDIAVDESSNVYTAGYFGGTVDFDPGVGTLSLTSNGASDSYVQKLDSDGDLAWAVSFGGIGNDIISGIDVDGSGNVLIAGHYEGTVDFDPGAGTSEFTTVGLKDAFVLKLDNSGNLVWMKNIGGSGWELAYDITTDATGNVYTAGSYFGTMDIDPGVGTVNLNTVGSYDNYVQKLNTDGEFVWAYSVGGELEDLVLGIEVDASANVYTAGYFSGTADFDPGEDSLELSSVVSVLSDMYVHKMSQVADNVSLIINNQVDFSLYPNPASSILTISSKLPIELISIYDLFGSVVQQESQGSFSIENLANGLYVLSVKTEQGTYQRRFVKL